MAIGKAPEGYGITGDIEGPTKWYPGPPVGEGGRIVTVSVTEEQLKKLRDLARVTGMTMGAVIREASREHAKATVEDPKFRRKAGELAVLLDRYKSLNSRESE